MNGYREQRPTPPNAWLYQDWSEDHREFFEVFCHWSAESQDLPECTQEEREQWEREHPQPEPAEVVE